jgi:hypothetical protein
MALDMRELARLGAEARVAEINAELAEIRRAFGTGRAGRRVQSGSGGGTLAPEESGKKQKRRSRPPMSAAQKAEVSKRMKKYWAARRKAQGA